MAAQWIRKMSMVVATDAGKTLDLSEMHVRFATRQADIQTPATLFARIYNLSDDRQASIRKEFTSITVQAGYEQPSNYGIAFKGTIKQIKEGRENHTDTYLELYCANNDLAYNFAVVSTNIAAGATPDQQIAAILTALKQYGVTDAQVAGLVSDDSTALPRGKVLHGAPADLLRDICATANCTYSLVDGRIQIMPNTTGALGNTAIVLNSQSGLVGVPELTEAGVRGRCLLNPTIRAGRLLQIDNKSINRTTKIAGNLQPGGFFQQYDSWTSYQYLASVDADSFYRVLVAEHVGDNRGQEWYTNFICLGLSDTTPPSLIARGIS